MTLKDYYDREDMVDYDREDMVDGEIVIRRNYEDTD